MKRAVKRWAFTGAGVVLAGGLMAAPAFASNCDGSPTSTCGGADGTVNVPPAASLSLTSAAFTLDAFAGQTSATPLGASPSASGFAIQAKVGSNDQAGYTLSQVEPQGENAAGGSTYGFYSSTSGTPHLPQPQAYSYAGNTGSFTAGQTFSSTDGTLPAPIVSNSTASAAGGDTWGLAWQFIVPSNQPNGTYNGWVDTILLGN